ncbi:MAG: hypothetical protein ACE5F8_03720 [Woeseiaceae bacterium]
MTDEIDSEVPTTFWIYSGAALVWNAIGLYAYWSFVTSPPQGNPAFTEAQQGFFAAMPGWVTSAYAIAVTAGTLGSVFLLLRKRWAYPAFIVSLLGVVAQNFHGFVLANALELFGAGATILPSLVFIVGAVLIIYSRNASARGWLS